MSHKVETLALHAGWRADPATGAVAVPIYQTTSYQFQSAEHAANLFALKELGNIYTRIMNPTNDVLEKRVAALEGGVAALALASGQAASAFSIQNLARAGDNIVSSTDLYGGTWNLFANTMKDQGIEVRFVDPADPENFRKATDARTRAYYAETLPNPKLIAFPIAEVAAIGRPLGVPLDHGQYRRADPDQAVRTWRGHHRLFVDQISRRPRHLDRRPDRRRRQFPVGRAQGAPARAQHARSQLSRRGVERGGQAARADRLHHQGARDLAARPRLLPCRRSTPSSRCRAWRRCRCGSSAIRRTPRRSRPGSANEPEVTKVIHPSLPDGRSEAASREISQGRPGRPGRLRDQRRQGGGAQVHRRAEAPLSRRQYRRRALARHPSGDHHPFAAHAGGAACDRRDGRLCPPVDRHRAHRRHSRRSRPGAEGGGVTGAAGATGSVARRLCLSLQIIWDPLCRRGRRSPDRPNLGFLDCRRFALEAYDSKGWIPLDFLGFSRANRDLSIGYEDFSGSFFSSRFCRRKSARETAAHDFGMRRDGLFIREV